MCAKRSDAAINPRDRLPALRGTQFVKASESDESKRLDSALLKAITGGDTIPTANMYESAFSYVPQFKVWLASNYEPLVTDVSDGMWRRVYRVNFENQVPEDKQDLQLSTKLVAELPGILNWALAGLQEYHKGGLQVPVAIVAAVAHYRHDQNPIKEFLETKFDLTGAQTDEIVGAEWVCQYNGWAKGLKPRALSSNPFGMAMRNLQIQNRRTKNGMVYWGIKAKPGIQVPW